MTLKYSDERLALLTAYVTRWPAGNAGSHWDQLRDAVEVAAAMVREADREVAAIKEKRELSDVGKQAEIAKACKRFIDLIGPTTDAVGMASARSAAEAFISKMESGQRLDVSTKPSAMTNEDALGSEIRAYIRSQSNPHSFAFANRANPSVYAAIANAPAFLSGMTEEQKTQVCGAALDALWPNERKAAAEARKALEQAEAIIVNAMRLVFELSAGTLVETGPGTYEIKRAKAA